MPVLLYNPVTPRRVGSEEVFLSEARQISWESVWLCLSFGSVLVRNFIAWNIAAAWDSLDRDTVPLVI